MVPNGSWGSYRPSNVRPVNFPRIDSIKDISRGMHFETDQSNKSNDQPFPLASLHFVLICSLPVGWTLASAHPRVTNTEKLVRYCSYHFWQRDVDPGYSDCNSYLSSILSTDYTTYNTGTSTIIA